MRKSGMRQTGNLLSGVWSLLRLRGRASLSTFLLIVLLCGAAWAANNISVAFLQETRTIYGPSGMFGVTRTTNDGKYRIHRGMDIKLGTEDLGSSMTGTVVCAKCWSSDPGTVMVASPGGYLMVMYAHGDSNGVKVSAGQQVTVGTPLMHFTNGGPTGHVHQEYIVKTGMGSSCYKVDPEVIRQMYTEGLVSDSAEMAQMAIQRTLEKYAPCGATQADMDRNLKTDCQNGSSQDFAPWENFAKMNQSSMPAYCTRQSDIVGKTTPQLSANQGSGGGVTGSTVPAGTQGPVTAPTNSGEGNGTDAEELTSGNATPSSGSYDSSTCNSSIMSAGGYNQIAGNSMKMLENMAKNFIIPSLINQLACPDQMISQSQSVMKTFSDMGASGSLLGGLGTAFGQAMSGIASSLGVSLSSLSSVANVAVTGLGIANNLGLVNIGGGMGPILGALKGAMGGNCGSRNNAILQGLTTPGQFFNPTITGLMQGKGG